MKQISKKLFSTLLTLTLTFVFVAGTTEIVQMASGHPIVASVLGSDGDTPYVPPTPVEKKTNTLSASGKTVSVTTAALADSNVTISRKEAISVSNPQGTVTYSKVSGNKKISVNSSNGKITVKKGLGQGTYQVKINVKAAGNSSYKAKTDKVTVTIKVVLASNPISVTTEAAELVVDDLESSDVVISVSDVLNVKKAKGALTYAKTIGSEGLSVDPDTGDITVEEGLPAGIYKVEVKVTAAGNKQYKDGSKTVVVTIKVKDPSLPDGGIDENVSSKLIAKMTTAGSKALKLSWNKVEGAEGYDIYFNRCNKKTKCKFVKSVSSSKTSWTKKGLKKGKAYKAYVKAWAMVDGQKTYIKTSPMAHAHTSGQTRIYTDPKNVSVNRREILLQQGGSFAVKAKIVKLNKGKLLVSNAHCEKVRYYSSSKKVATVSKKGKIQAVGAGTCKIYVVAQNGISKVILVTVLD